MSQGTAQKGTQPISATALPLPAGAATQATLAALLTELLLKARLADTQPVSIASAIALDAATLAALESITVVDGGGSITVDATALPLPAGASTEVTLAAIKAKTDNLDVALSTRTKPADTQTISATALPLPANAAQETGGALAAIITELLLKARLTDTQPVSVAGVATAANQTTELASLTTIAAELGAVSSSPGAYTVMDRLNTLGRKLDGICKTAATEATLKQLITAVKPVPGASAVRTTLLHR